MGRQSRAKLAPGEVGALRQDSASPTRRRFSTSTPPTSPQFDCIVVTPGLPLNRHPIAAARPRRRGSRSSATSNCSRGPAPSLPPHKVVGITGTNGKSTTTALVHHILQDRGRAEPDGRQHRPADPGAGPAARRRRLCPRTVELPDRPDPEPRLRRRGAAQHHARPSRSVRRASRPMPRRRRGCSRCSRRAMPAVDRRSTAEADDHVSTTREQIAGRSQLHLTDRRRRVHGARSSAWPALQGPHNRAECRRCDRRVPRLSGSTEARSSEGLRTYPGLPHRMERVAREATASCSSTTARRPTRPRPRPRSPPFRAIRWILGGQAKSDNLDECAPHFGHVAQGLYHWRGGRIVRVPACRRIWRWQSAGRWTRR